MDHNRSKHLIGKEAEKKLRAMPVQTEKDICRAEKLHKINMILLYAKAWKYDMATLRSKNLKQIRDIYDREVEGRQ